MNIELTILAWGCVLAIVHLFAAVRAKTAQYGTKWNTGARDEEVPPLNPVGGRLARAQANFYETFPLYAAAALMVSYAHLTNRWTAIGAMLWIGARILYLPVYALGIPYLRSLLWALGAAGIVMVLWPALAATF
jgi:uncharacterized MAPEG superfamily protein